MLGKVTQKVVHVIEDDIEVTHLTYYVGVSLIMDVKSLEIDHRWEILPIFSISDNFLRFTMCMAIWILRNGPCYTKDPILSWDGFVVANICPRDPH